MPGAPISAVGLSKDYGGGRGLVGLDLEVERGEVFGFLGPNGAGKTTTIRLLMGMIRPTAGSASIFGLDSQRDAVATKRLVGFVPGELPQFGGLRGSEVVGYLGGLRGGVDAARVKSLADRLELNLGLRFREYSRGNKQKLALVLAFMHRPDLLILDEPTGGLDPLNQQEFYRMVLEAKAAGATVFLSSHILSEVEHICDRVGIVRHGRLIKVADLDDLHDLRVRKVEVKFAGPVPDPAIRALPGTEGVEVHGQTLTCTVKGSFSPFLDVLARADVHNLTSEEPTLEEVFLTYYSEKPAAPEPEPVA